MLIFTKLCHITPLIFLLLLLTHQIQAQPTAPGRTNDPNNVGNMSPTMGVVIIVLIAALFFMGFFSIYIRHCNDDTSTTGGVVRRGIGSIRLSRRAPRGLDAEVMESFPTFNYADVKSAKIGKGALECAVCLTEFEDDDTLRLIPKCDHVFHPDCIDAWLVDHTTCPVCRCNLADGNSTLEDQDSHRQPNDIVVVNVSDGEIIGDEDHRQPNNESNTIDNDNESMEQPLHGRTMSRNRTMRNLSFGRARLWFGNKYTRSYLTGHVAVKQWENMERFTLRLPEELRKQIMSGKLERSTSLVILPRESSSRRGYRTGFGEGSSRSNRVGASVRSDRTGRSDRWVFKLAPPFISRAPSLKSPNKVGPISPTSTSRGGSLRGGSVRENVGAINREGSLRGAMQAELSLLPV